MCFINKLVEYGLVRITLVHLTLIIYITNIILCFNVRQKTTEGLINLVCQLHISLVANNSYSSTFSLPLSILILFYFSVSFHFKSGLLKDTSIVMK